MDQLAALRALRRVVELGSFTAAADALDISHTIVSRQIRQLEEQLGAQLLNRTTRRFALTAAGKEYYDASRQILDALDAADRAVGQHHARPSGSLRINAPMAFGTLEAVPQPEAGVTYAAKISKEEATLDFTLSAQEIGRKIRAFNPFPGAHGSVNGVIVKLWGAEVLAADSSAPAGEVLAADAQHGIVIACGGGGSLRLTELQKPGGKRLPAHEFIKGFPLEGQRFA